MAFKYYSKINWQPLSYGNTPRSAANFNKMEDQVETCHSFLVQRLPPGTVAWYPFAVAPSGWYKCNGDALNGTVGTYTPLWNAIGTTYGGSGQASFNVPDLRSYFIRAAGGNAAAIGSLQADQTLQHNHPHSLINNDRAYSGGTTATYLAAATARNSFGNTGNADMRPKNIALLPVIKL